LAALRFLYVKTLRRAWSVGDTPYPKKSHRLPTVLSREEVAQLIHAARTPRERILLITLYATGARNSELTHLKVTDIDSQRMVVHIRGGKGGKDRDVMLSPRLLTALRAHWCYYRGKSSAWRFPSNYPQGPADRYENRLVRLSEIRPAGGHPEKGSPPHASSLFRYTSV